MYTVITLPTFQRQAAAIWTEHELNEFIDWIAVNPLAGDVIPATGGARKVRWAVAGRGKRGGARVVYFNFLDEGHIQLIAVYAKNEQTNITAKEINHAR